MTSIPAITLILPLGKRSMSQLVAEAERMGLPPEDYAKQLIEEGLAAQRQGESMTFGEIMKPVRQATGAVNESEIIKLVDRIRPDKHHRRR